MFGVHNLCLVSMTSLLIKQYYNHGFIQQLRICFLFWCMQWIFTEFYLIALFSYVQMIVLLQRAHFLKLLITVHIKKKSFMNYFKPGIFAEIRAPLTSLMYTKRASVVQNNMHGIFDLFSPLFKTIWHWLFYCL